MHKETQLNNSNFAPLALRAKALSVCTICFFTIYILAGYYAKSRGVSDSFLFNGEKQIPFLPWFIIPYTSSSILFVYQFYLCTNSQDLRVLTYRILFITFTAGLSYFYFPLRFKFEKPRVENDFLDVLVHLFKSYDTNYNQAPSLHVSFACIFFLVILRQKIRLVYIGLWFVWTILVIASTVFVYQHHLIDVITALILVAVTLILFPNKKSYCVNTI